MRKTFGQDRTIQACSSLDLTRLSKRKRFRVPQRCRNHGIVESIKLTNKCCAKWKEAFGQWVIGPCIGLRGVDSLSSRHGCSSGIRAISHFTAMAAVVNSICRTSHGPRCGTLCCCLVYAQALEMARIVTYQYFHSKFVCVVDPFQDSNISCKPVQIVLFKLTRNYW
jgi:hypothetical protein